MEEMKVELALLSDSATFPYYLVVRSSGSMLQVHGYVPNDSNRQRALQLANQNTTLQVMDGMTIQPGLNQRPPLRGSQVLQREGAALLAQNFGAASKQMHFEARPNGLVIVSGTIGSVEEKLAVSRLFHQLPGCSGVVNQLTLQPILRDGQRWVRVTKDGSQMTGTTALGPGLEPARPVAAVAQRLPVFPGPVPDAPKPAFVSASSLDAHEEELRLPTKSGHELQRVAANGASAPAKKRMEQAPRPSPVLDKRASVDVLTAPALPERWSRPATPRQAEIRAENAPTSPAGVRPAIAWEPEKAKKSAAPPLSKAKRPAILWESMIRRNKSNAEPSAASQPMAAPPPTAQTTRPRLAPTPLTPPPPRAMASPANTNPSVVRNNGLSAPPMPAKESGPALRSTFRWPPAHPPSGPPPAARPVDPPLPAQAIIPPMPSPRLAPPPPAAKPVPPPPPVQTKPSPSANVGRPGAISFDEPSEPPINKDAGRSGSIVFEESNPPARNPAIGLARPIVPAELRRQVAAVCGRQARDLQVELQRDGSILVNVKVANAAVERQLTRKILTIPDMAASNVHLAVQIGP